MTTILDKPPETKLEAVRLLAYLEKDGIKIQCSEGINWRMIPLSQLIRLAQRYWADTRAATTKSQESSDTP
jgi:hypothetical protein